MMSSKIWKRIYCAKEECGDYFEVEEDSIWNPPSAWTQKWMGDGHGEYNYFCPRHKESLAVKTNPILNVIDELRETLKAKQADYAGTDPFNNFTESAATADITPRQAALTLLGVKLSRIRNLERQNNEAANEPLLDSYLDLAGYAIILYAMAKETQ